MEQQQERKEFKVVSFLLYVVIAYGFSWTFWLPQVLASNGLFPWSFFSYVVGFIAPFGPSVSAFSVTRARKYLTGAEAFMFAAGGIYGAEGSVWIGVKGDSEQLEKAENLINEYAKEPPCEI